MQDTSPQAETGPLSALRIAVIGGGIGGVSAALALARRGAVVDVYEKAAALGEVGAGLQISPNGVAVLDALGIKAEATAVASAPDSAILLNSRGRQVAHVPLGHAAEQRYDQPYWQFHRADMLDILVAAARAAGVRFHLGHRAEGQPDGGVSVAGQSHQFDGVIAADGVRSAHRAGLFGGAEPEFLNHVAWRALIPADGLDDAARTPQARLFMGSGRHLVAYPLRQARLINLVGIVEWNDWVGEGWSQRDDGDEFRAAFRSFSGPVPRMLAHVNHCYKWGLFGHAPVVQWAEGRLALLGDACHPTLPFLAQGATQALEDGWALAACLAGDPEDVARALRRYQSLRKSRADAIVAAASRAGRIYHLKSPITRTIAHLGMRGLARLAPGLLQRRFDWIYGTRPLGR